ncbi:MAG TPA: lysylphosphatidylglycerol synthase domain-containing protein [Verrucomicrobiae bacterium]|jgi:lysylphosphatidylglycerol synthase-like protein|nr:lysylphosphatidylglycerol synthase domain-containing protein [Verrucomicrobiae bacterium]
MRGIRLVLLGVGTALCIGLLWRTGVDPVLSAFAMLSWRLPLLLCFPACLMIACDTLGWRFSFRRDRVPLRTLVSARLAGEALNITTPTASVGGEAVKAWLVRSYVPLTESLPSVVIAKTTITIGQTLFLLLGISVAWSILPAGSRLLRSMQWLLVLECLGTAGFVAVQLLGATGGVGRLLQRLGLLGGEDREPALRQIDRAFVHFYRQEPRRLGLSIGWHLAGWVLGALEAYCILQVLGFPVSLGLATMVDAFGAGVGFAAFFIPARLGAQEAGDVAVFTALGFGAPAGLAFSLVRRLREALWAAVGFLALAALQRTDAVPTAAREA